MKKKAEQTTRKAASSRSGAAAPRPGAAAKRSKKTSPRWHEAVIAEYERLKAWPNVERVAIGWKEREGRVTARLAVKIYVAEKKGAPSKEEVLPKWTTILVPVGKGMYRSRRVPTDVIWHAPAVFCATPGAQGPTEFLNPIPSGGMVGLPGQVPGTFACMTVNAAGQQFALTAGHVVQAFQGAIGASIQVHQPPSPPPTMPPGTSTLMGATVQGFFGGTPQGFLDFVLVRLRVGRTGLTDALDGLPVVRQVLPSAFVINNRIRVTKFGAITGRTSATFATLVGSLVVNGINVTNVLEFHGDPGTAFGANGDSGALVVSEAAGTQGRVIGLLIATAPSTPDSPGGRGFVVPFDRIPGVGPV